MKNEKRTKIIDKYLKGGPLLVPNSAAMGEVSSDLAEFSAIYKNGLCSYSIDDGFANAVYAGTGEKLVSSYFDKEKNTLLKTRCAARPVNWTCHKKLGDFKDADTVISVWERGNKANDFIKEFNYDIHFEDGLPFKKFLTKSVVIYDEKEKRVHATAFQDWQERPQKLGAMFYIMMRQGIKKNFWAHKYVLAKRAGFTPAEALLLAASNVSYYIFSGIRSLFIRDGVILESLIKSEIKGGLSLLRNPDQGDGPIGKYLQTYKGVYPNFTDFKDCKINYAHILKTPFTDNQPSNDVFKMNVYNSNIENYERCFEHRFYYLNVFKGVLEKDAILTRDSVQALREIEGSRKGLFTNA